MAKILILASFLLVGCYDIKMSPVELENMYKEAKSKAEDTCSKNGGVQRYFLDQKENGPIIFIFRCNDLNVEGSLQIKKN